MSQNFRSLASNDVMGRITCDMQYLQRSGPYLISYVPFQIYIVDAGLLIRQTMFLNGVLSTSEIWPGLDTTNLTMLPNMVHQLMRVICHNAHTENACRVSVFGNCSTTIDKFSNFSQNNVLTQHID